MEVDEAAKVSVDGECSLVWEGGALTSGGKKWRVQDIRSEHEAKRILTERGLPHLWSQVVQFSSTRGE